MNYKKILFPAFILLVLLQLFVPASMIFHQEDILETGKAFKFKTAPIDPYDPFRGKYIWLNFEATNVKVTTEEDYEYGETLYAELITDEQGYAKIRQVSKIKPDSGVDYVQVSMAGENKRDSTLQIRYPFDRFYMEESKALAAEETYNELRNDEKRTAYALVKIKNGDAVLENVFIDGVPIKEVVERSRE